MALSEGAGGRALQRQPKGIGQQSQQQVTHKTILDMFVDWATNVCVCVCVCVHIRHTMPCLCTSAPPHQLWQRWLVDVAAP